MVRQEGLIGNEHRSSLDEKIFNFVEKSIPYINGGLQDKQNNLNSADRLGILISAIGLYNPRFDVPMTGIIELKDYSTYDGTIKSVPIRNIGANPFVLEFLDRQDFKIHRVDKAGNVINTWDARYKVIFRNPANFFFNQLGKSLERLPVSISANPNEKCSNTCLGCYRTSNHLENQIQDELPEKQEFNYIKKHLRGVESDFVTQFSGIDKNELKCVSIVTGCQTTSKKEFEMFRDVIRSYKDHGFNPNYLFFSCLIETEEQMLELREMGVVGYISTLECFDYNKRMQIWGKKKGCKTFEQHLDTLIRAKEIFPIAEAALVLGHDRYEDMIRGLDQLDSKGITVSPSSPRSYSRDQFNFLSDDVWSMSLPYFLKAFEKVIEMNKINSSGNYLRELGLEFLKKRNPFVTSADLPRRYR